MSRRRDLEAFANVPVRQAVLTQIAPAVASQMITLVYNLADTFFVGLLNDPHQTAAVTVAYPSFVMLTAISNLFGVGGASAIARSLGRRDEAAARRIAALSLYGGIASALLFSLAYGLLAEPVLEMCGATADTYDIARGYAMWVVVLGGPFTILNTLLANLIRAEGGAGTAAVGVSLGGVLNIFLDPLFVLPRFLGLGAVGAGMATALSNGAAVAYFAVCLLRRRKATYLSLSPAHLRGAGRDLGGVLAIGFPSALQYALTVVATAAQARFVAQYPTEAVAALGIVKKLDQLPLYFSIGVSNGLLPLLAFNHAAGDHRRREEAFRLGTGISFGFAAACLVCYELFAGALTGLFIQDPETVRYGAVFLQCMVTAMPLMALCYPLIIQFQAMGRARESLVCSVLRKGVLDIPLLFLLDRLFPLYGCMWVQPIVDAVSLAAALWFYRRRGGGHMRPTEHDFSRGSIPRNILALAAPMTAAQLINVLYSVVDRIYLGRLPGHLALTGLGLVMPIISIVMGFANLCGTGGAPLCSIQRGRGDTEEAERVMGNAFTLLLIFGAVVTAVFLVLQRPMLYLFGASDATYPYAADYMTIYMLGTVFVMIGLGMNPFITAQGFGGTGMMTVGLGAIVNIVLDPVFIFALDMGVQGAALATVIAQACSAAWALKFLTGRRALLRLRLKYMALSARRVRDIVALGLSGFFMNFTTSVVQVVCNATLQAWGGDLYVGVMTIVNSIREVFFMPIHGLTNGAQPVTGYNYGARLYSRVRESARFSVVVTVAYAAAFWVVAMVFPGALIRIFNSEPEVVAAGIPALRIYFSMFVFMSLHMAGQGVFVSLGRSRQAIFFSVLRKAVINAPLTVLLPVWLDTTGVFVAEAISQLVSGMACILTMYFTVYRPLRRLPDQPRREA